jgi:hypothetical protein
MLLWSGGRSTTSPRIRAVRLSHAMTRTNSATRRCPPALRSRKLQSNFGRLEGGAVIVLVRQHGSVSAPFHHRRRWGPRSGVTMGRLSRCRYDRRRRPGQVSRRPTGEGRVEPAAPIERAPAARAVVRKNKARGSWQLPLLPTSAHRATMPWRPGPRPGGSRKPYEQDKKSCSYMASSTSRSAVCTTLSSCRTPQSALSSCRTPQSAASCVEVRLGRTKPVSRGSASTAGTPERTGLSSTTSRNEDHGNSRSSQLRRIGHGRHSLARRPAPAPAVALEVVDDAPLHLLRPQPAVVPDHRQDRDVDVGEDVGRSASDGQDPDHHDEPSR